MERNLDRGFDKRTETTHRNESGSKTPKTDKVKTDTREKLKNNLK